MALFGPSKADPMDAARMRRATAAEQRAVLAVLLGGRPHDVDPAVDQFLDFAHQQGMDISDLWAAWQGLQPFLSVLMIRAAGRTAMAFLGPLNQRPSVPILGELLYTAANAQNRDEVHLVQALLDPSQKLEHQACQRAGFKDLATLVYMQRHTEAPMELPPLPVGVQVQLWDESQRELFRRCILASYEGTQDCPGLLGLRQVDDIIAGHMASGRFTPQHWQALHVDGQPVAVMLLNDVAQRDSVELVYLGIAPAWRGHGLGRVLLQRGLAMGHQHGAAQMMLAVDQANAPAVRLYQSLRFSATSCKVAMIFTLLPSS